MSTIFKGFLIGIGKILPGVSGAMIAITLGEYDKIIENIANLKIDLFNKLKYLSKIGLGITIAVITISKIIVKCLNNYYLPTMLLFIGIIIGGMPKIIKKIKINIKEIIFSIIFFLPIIYFLTKSNIVQNHIIIKYNIIEFTKLIGIGIIDALSSIIPGISGTAILMYLGYYNTLLNTFSTITDITLIYKNIFILFPFVIGFIIGTIAISKIINIIIKTKRNIIYIITTILMIYTSIILLINTLKYKQTIVETIISIFLFTFSFIITQKISNKK